jgi:hypothetical protein
VAADAMHLIAMNLGQPSIVEKSGRTAGALRVDRSHDADVFSQSEAFCSCLAAATSFFSSWVNPEVMQESQPFLHANGFGP